jgi:EAL domain-containing protein (putative c-di-GMP-specific phosphodiesterase class I)
MNVAEQLHLVPDIDRRMVELAHTTVARLKHQGLHLPKISFNVSPGRLQAPDLTQTAASGAFGDTEVVFELLESILLEEESSIFKCHLKRVREAGIGVEIDDFGSGHASILSVMQVEPRALKIDRRLIAPIAKSNRARKMVRAIMEIANTLEVSTIAEGVETKEQQRILREEGCDILQGFFFAPALCEEDLLRFAGADRLAYA